MRITDEIKEKVLKGKAKAVKELTERALGEGVSPESILYDAFISAMTELAEKYSEEKIFVPEVLVSSRAFNAGLSVIEPLLVKESIELAGKAVIGTVKGDIHDIGKNILGIMLKGAGFEVIDLGTDVSPKAFADKAEETGADAICLSALLTTTMPGMKETVKELEKRGIREKYIVVTGGAPVTQKYSREIGADVYADDAAKAAESIKKLIKERKSK